MFARSWPEMATTEPGMWSIALAVRVALTTTYSDLTGLVSVPDDGIAEAEEEFTESML